VWLIINVKTEQAGHYRVDLRNIHKHPDGDNDAWIDVVGRYIASDDAIGRLGDSHADGTGFTWLDWGIYRVWLSAGLNHFYIGGRSTGFGIDRIAVYPEGDDERRARALNLDTPPSLQTN
jgi:hypothetical protein